MPKTELHLHLEGAIPLDTMWDLIGGAGGDPAVPTPRSLVDRFTYLDFAEFIDTWVWKNRFLDSTEAFEVAAEAVARSLIAQHIVYAEVFFSPTDFAMHGLSPQEIAVALRRGLDRVDGTTVALIVDLVRDTGPVRSMRTFDQVREVADEAGVIGIGIGGSEREYPPELFVDVYRRAAEAGFHRTAHAGEAAGARSVAAALDALEVERIGHGVRAVEDEAVLGRLVESGVPLEVCPTSNIRTGVVASWELHPVQRLIEAGAAVTINTDDPAMFHCTLGGEYGLLVDRFGFDLATVERLSHLAIDASWTHAAAKRCMHDTLTAWWADPHVPGPDGRNRTRH